MDGTKEDRADGTSRARRYLLASLAVCFVAALALEMLVFNLPHWTSLGFKPAGCIDVSYGSGLEPQGGDGYLVADPSEAYIDIAGINMQAQNLYLDADVDGGEFDAGLKMSDEAYSDLYDVPDISIYAPVEASKYVRLHSSGTTSRIRVDVGKAYAAGTVVTIRDMEVNKAVPFVFHPARFLAAFIIALVIALLLPCSPLYQVPFDIYSAKQGVALCAVLVVMMAGSFQLDTLNGRGSPYTQNDGSGIVWLWDEYGVLTDSLMHGSVSLDLPVPEWLKALPNPYDPAARNARATYDEPYFVDCAYYQGRYYCYFGITPVLVVGIPYAMVMGHHASTATLVLIWGLIAEIALFVLLRQLFDRYGGARTSVGLFCIIWVAMLCASGFLYHLLLPQTYSVPYMAGFACLFFGFAAWLKALNAKRGRGRMRGTLRRAWLAMGSCCIALAIGCRPTMFLAIILAFPLFYQEIFKERLFFARSKESLANTLSIIIPCVVLGFLFGLYNYARFGSLLDFGAAYNLTSNDMTRRGFVFARYPLGLFEYLIQPLQVSSSFPFLSALDASALVSASTYYGRTSAEPLYGGFLWFNPLVIYVTVKVFRDRKDLDRGMRLLYWTTMALGLVTLLFVIQYSGITQRYMSDFGWLWGLGTIIGLLALLDVASENEARSLLRGAIALTMVSVVLAVMTIPMQGAYTAFRYQQPYAYYLVRSMFMLM